MNKRHSVAALGMMILAALACKLPATIAPVNLYEGTNMQEAARQIEAKIGGTARMSSLEIRKDEVKVQAQDPKNAKNLDAYKYKNGVVTGPEPVQVFSLGNNDFTPDKMQLFTFSDLNLAAIPEAVRKAIEYSQLENGEVELIQIEQVAASLIGQDKRTDEQKRAEMLRGKIANPLALGWRLFVSSPRGRKSFYADAQGNVINKPF